MNEPEEGISPLYGMLLQLAPVFAEFDPQVVDWISEFIDVGEYELAYEHIIWGFQASRKRPSDATIAILNELADMMKLERWSPEPPPAQTSRA